MAGIVIVHGIGNQYVGENALLAAWHPALCDGLNRAGHVPLPPTSACHCPYYGDLFRAAGHLGGSAAFDDDWDGATEDEIRLVVEIWERAAASDERIPGPAAFGETLAAAPRWAERALNALAKSEFLANAIPLRFFGDLKQVVAYLDDAGMRAKILDRVLPHIGPETRIVIGHSLGSVVAYEALCEKPENVSTLLTVGSPLGLRNVVFDKLTPKPLFDGAARWPRGIRHWRNVAARGDIVAAQKELRPLFGGELEDRLIDSGWDAHSSTRYLNTREAGEAVARALA